MNARKIIKEAAYRLICTKAIQELPLKAILEAAEVSKQTFYRYYEDKYVMVNELYDELFVTPFYTNAELDWACVYKKQFAAYRTHLPFMRNLFSSRETGCTTEHEIKICMDFDRDWIARKGGDLKDPRIQFAIEAKDVGGTYAMRS